METAKQAPSNGLKEDSRIQVLGKKLKNQLIKTFKPPKPFYRFLFVFGIIYLGWIKFIQLVEGTTIENTSALIMVWLSVLVLLLAAYPEILERIRKVKIPNFEIELQEAIKKTSSEIDLSIKDLTTQELSFEKEDWTSLWPMLKTVFENPEKDVVLHVNLDKRINAPTLYVYITLFELMSKTTTILFKTNSRQKNFTVVGAISGKKVLQMLSAIDSKLLSLYREDAIQEVLTWDWTRRVTQQFTDNQIPNINQYREQNRRIVTKREILFWMKGSLSTTIINFDLGPSDVEKIRSAFAKEEDYLIIFKDGEYHSVLPLCLLANDISKSALQTV